MTPSQWFRKWMIERKRTVSKDKDKSKDAETPTTVDEPADEPTETPITDAPELTMPFTGRDDGGDDS